MCKHCVFHMPIAVGCLCELFLASLLSLAGAHHFLHAERRSAALLISTGKARCSFIWLICMMQAKGGLGFVQLPHQLPDGTLNIWRPQHVVMGCDASSVCKKSGAFGKRLQWQRALVLVAVPCPKFPVMFGAQRDLCGPYLYSDLERKHHRLQNSNLQIHV